MIPFLFSKCLVIFSAYVLDLLLGDPRWLPHPVVWMGNAISFFEKRFRRWIADPFLSGLFFALFLILSTWGMAYGTVRFFSSLHPLAGTTMEVILLFYCLSARTLEKAAVSVSEALEKEGIDAGRHAVSMIVGREVKYLDETGVVRAAVETVAENFVDGFLAPLFFAVIGGVPMAVAYKMINTLDSMVGYRNEKYILFGRASARIDDAANFIPARLSVPIIAMAAALLSTKRGIRAWRNAVLEGRCHKSPNAGYPEAAFAGALGVSLGGPNHYHGILVEKPYLGSRFTPPGKEKIRKACELMILSSFVTVLIVLGSCTFALLL